VWKYTEGADTPGRIPATKRSHHLMKKMKAASARSSATWDTLESFARMHVKGFIQPLLEEEVTELLARPKSARLDAVLE